MPQRKYMQRTMVRGEVQIVFRKVTASMNFWVSMAIRLMVSPMVISLLDMLDRRKDFLKYLLVSFCLLAFDGGF